MQKVIHYRYGLYASGTRGKWTEHPEIIRHAPSGWKVAQQESSGNKKTIDEEDSEVSDRASRKAWARLLTIEISIFRFSFRKQSS